MTNKKKRNIRNCSYLLFFAPQKTRLKLIIYKSVTHLKWMHKLMNKIMLNQFGISGLRKPDLPPSSPPVYYSCLGECCNAVLL